MTYEVDAGDGGYLSMGKLTGKVEVEKARGFSIRTPTAIVTDLGTEFGVEVDRTGATRSYVFRGMVRVQLCSKEKGTAEPGQVLHEKDFAKVESSRNCRPSDCRGSFGQTEP